MTTYRKTGYALTPVSCAHHFVRSDTKERRSKYGRDQLPRHFEAIKRWVERRRRSDARATGLSFTAPEFVVQRDESMRATVISVHWQQAVLPPPGQPGVMVMVQ